jgi:ligand-binding sensor protein
MRPEDYFSSQLPPAPKVALRDLINVSEIQEMQDSFAEVANVAVRTVDPQGVFMTAMSRVPELCGDSLKSPTVKDELCRCCLPGFLGGEGIVDEDLSYECVPGLTNYLVPLKISLSRGASLILGYMVIGPIIFMKRRDKQDYAELAMKLDMDLEHLWSQLLEFRVFSYKGIRSFLDMVSNLTGHILNLAYAKRMMQDEISKGLLEPVVMAAAGVTLQEFIELFLDLVMDITNGSTGSIMLLDRASRSLKIKAAHGLSPKIVAETTVRLGDGVSGLAAQTKRPFLINEQNADPLISDRLNKPQLFSSLVVPIKYGESVYGVINVSSDKTLPVIFDESTLAIVSRAAGLAGVALQRFQN